MKITSWNVNSLQVRLPHLLAYLQQEQPDIMALQETKTPDARFPLTELEEAGYRVSFAGQKSYNGVALLARSPLTDVVTDLPGLDDPQRRLLAATVGDLRVIDVYIPNGQEVGSDKYAYKFRWLEALAAFIEAELVRHQRLLILGDFNIAPADIDVHDPARWQGRITCSDAERACFQRLLQIGLCDTLRTLQPDASLFSWWDYRASAFRRNWGIRIDHILASPAITLQQAGIDRSYRKLERPSDHAPVWLTFE